MNKNKFFMAGNWKMNVPSSDAKALVEEIVESINDIKNVDVLVCPPFTSIASAKEGLNGSLRVMVGAQNFYPEKSGAYTGEISAIMLREMGVTHVIVGHSERRAYFYEANDFINKKVIAAISNSLVPILCVGETIEQRRAGNAFNVVEEQLLSCLKDVHIDSANKLIIAYEPVWAIGTGETATPEIAQEMHAFIRKLLSEKFGKATSSSIMILYGGSMKPENTRDLLSQEDINGGLIGGASLKASSFCEMISIADKLLS